MAQSRKPFRLPSLADKYGLNGYKQRVKFVDLGRMSYREAADIQRETQELIIEGLAPNTLFFVEHEKVYTLGASFHPENLLLTRKQYEDLGFAIEETERGGDVTYHGPKQLVIYPVFNVAEFGRDLHQWLRALEEAMILAVGRFGLKGERMPEINTGIWVNGKKIGAIGVKVRKWVSIHGIALNCSNDLLPFEYIVPCGIRSHGVTSLTEELGREVGIEEVKPFVLESFERVFDIEWLEELVG